MISGYKTRFEVESFNHPSIFFYYILKTRYKNLEIFIVYPLIFGN
jgi:hypothetical protein